MKRRVMNRDILTYDVPNTRCIVALVMQCTTIPMSNLLSSTASKPYNENQFLTCLSKLGYRRLFFWTEQ